MHLKKMIYFFAILLVLLSGCVFEVNTDNFGTRQNTEQNEMFLMGRKMKSVSDMPDAEVPVILVNGNAITKKDIESKKILCEFNEDLLLKEEINELIRAEVAIIEARRLNIEPSQDEVDAYIMQTAMLLETNDETVKPILQFIEGMDITSDEYLAILREKEYENTKRMALWGKVRTELEEKISSEATTRKVDLGIVDSEYYEKYIDDLIEKADIEILDEELENVLKE